MLKRLRSRLRNNRGESLTEVLVAVLISSIALLMLASMVGTTQDLVRRSKEATQNYVSASNLLVEKGGDDDDQEEGDVQFSVILIDGGNATDVKLTDDSDPTMKVLYYVNDEIGIVPVTSYKKGG